MWTRGELKSRAKYNLGRYYWIALVVCFVAGLLGGGSGGSFNAGGFSTSLSSQSAQNSDSVINNLTSSEAMVIISILLGVIGFMFLFALLFGTFVGSPVTVGKARFFMESREMSAGNAGIGKIFYSFSHGYYWNTVKVMFLRNLFINLWSLLLIVPGIIKAYEYYMVPYILSENPQIHYKDALALSKDMMNGHKMNTFILELSFFGWLLLGALACGIGVYFVLPYYETTFAELYAVLRNNVSTDLLPGFGIYQEYEEPQPGPDDYYRY